MMRNKTKRKERYGLIVKTLKIMLLNISTMLIPFKEEESDCNYKDNTTSIEYMIEDIENPLEII